MIQPRWGMQMRTKVGHYDVVCELGRGGMGVVYKGFESALNRYVAIKTLSESLSHDESVKERFLREARAMAQLNDAHIIQIYFIGEDQNQPFFAMEFVEGESLSSFLKREGRMTPDQAAKVIHQTALGLAVAHDAGVVHRDIKPANLMLTTRGTIKIADFGIALAQQDFSKKLTATGEFVGTPGYLSPEVCLAKPMDLRSDIFSLGIVLFEMLTGRMPFTDESPLGLLLEVVRAEVPDVRQLNGEVDAELAQILSRMVAKEPADRYASCHDLVAALQHLPAIQKGGPISVRAKLPLAASTTIGSLPTPAALSRDTPALPLSNLPTPPPLPGATRLTPATAQVAAVPGSATAPGIAAHVPVMDRGSSPRRHGPWLVAAALVLALVGTAFAFRDQLPFIGAGTAGQSTATAPTSADGASTVADAAEAQPTHTGIAASDDGEETPDNAPGLQALNDLAQSRKALESAGTETAMAPASAPATASAEAPTAINTAVTEAPRPAVARIAAAPKPQRPAGPPRIMVLAIGDRGLTSAAERTLEAALSEQGFRLADEDAIPGMNAILNSRRPDVPRLLGLLARANNVSAVTVIKAEPLGTSELQFYGRRDTLYSANLHVRTYDVFDRSVIGAGINTKVDFTNTSAEQKGSEAVNNSLADYLESVSRYRR